MHSIPPNVTPSMGAYADAYRQQHGFPCQVCRNRFPQSQLCGIKTAGRYVDHCVDCARARRTADRAARLTSQTIPCQGCLRTLPMLPDASFSMVKGLIVCSECAANA